MKQPSIIPKGTPVEIIAVHKKDSYSLVVSNINLTGLKVHAGEELTANELEPGYYQGDVIKDNGSRMFFYAVKLKVLEGGENDSK